MAAEERGGSLDRYSCHDTRRGNLAAELGSLGII
jgi:hypothetical protein